MEKIRYAIQDSQTGELLSYIVDFPSGKATLLWVEGKETARVFEDLTELFLFEDSLEVELEDRLTVPVYYDTLQNIYNFSPPENSSNHASNSSTSS